MFTNNEVKTKLYKLFKIYRITRFLKTFKFHEKTINFKKKYHNVY